MQVCLCNLLHTYICYFMYRMFLEEYDLKDSNNRACFLDTEAGDRSLKFYFHLIFLLFFFSLSPLCSYNKQKDFTKGCTPLTLFPTALFRCVNTADIFCECLNGFCTLGAAVPHPSPLGVCCLLGGLHTWVRGCWCDPLSLGHCDGFLRKQRACLVTG